MSIDSRIEQIKNGTPLTQVFADLTAFDGLLEDKYTDILASEDKPLTVHLSHHQQRLILALFDYGLSVLDDENNQYEFNAIIAMLKDQIHQ